MEGFLTLLINISIINDVFLKRTKKIAAKTQSTTVLQLFMDHNKEERGVRVAEVV